MIAPMKKLFLVLLSAEKGQSLNQLRDLGLVHIRCGRVQETALFQKLLSDISRTQEVLEFFKDPQFKGISSDPASPETGHSGDPSLLTDEVLSLKNSLKEKEEQIQELRGELTIFQNWGDFDPSLIRELDSKGFSLELYEMTKEELSEPGAERDYLILKKCGKKYLTVLLQKAELSLKPLALPSADRESLKKEISAREKDLLLLKEKLGSLKQNHARLENHLKKLIADLEFENASMNASPEGNLCIIRGFIPSDEADRLSQTARKHSWGLLLTDPEEEEAVPVLLKNNKFVRLISPLFKFLDILPGYRETDISLFFLIFFSLFFPLLIGDGGYGLLFLGTVIFFHMKRKKLNDFLKLAYLLSILTVVWGALTGSWFGVRSVDRWYGFKNLILPSLSSLDPERSQETLIGLSFILGTVQIGIAYLSNFSREFPRLKSLAQIGWFFINIGLYYLVLLLVLQVGPLPHFALWFIGGGFLLVTLFGGQEKGQSFLKGLGKGAGGLFNQSLDTISAFSNIISYIRLFAVGMASSAIAVSFNSIASPLLRSWGFVFGLLILLLGHSLNMGMGALAVLVHGARLNLLEFAGNMGIEWSGIGYRPFKKDTEKENIEK